MLSLTTNIAFCIDEGEGLLRDGVQTIVFGHWSKCGIVEGFVNGDNASNVFNSEEVYNRIQRTFALEGEWILDLTGAKRR